LRARLLAARGDRDGMAAEQRLAEQIVYAIATTITDNDIRTLFLAAALREIAGAASPA
jgi:hypothetical protein